MAIQDEVERDYRAEVLAIIAEATDDEHLNRLVDQYLEPMDDRELIKLMPVILDLILDIREGKLTEADLPL